MDTKKLVSIDLKAAKAKVKDSSLAAARKAKSSLVEKAGDVRSGVNHMGQRALKVVVGQGVSLTERQLEALRELREKLG